MSNKYSAQDEQWMQHALDLARRGVALASPNPMVGCVIVRDGVVVGEGFHRYALRDHAEVVALKMAGENARGATAYVTLEPCSHTGRTPPCADALIAAGVKRVIAATLDPNPVVRGEGISNLKAASIDASSGLLQDKARAINIAFAKSIRTHLPFVTLKSAVSADGMLAPSPDLRDKEEPFWLTGEAARDEVHQLRHASDAVLTGVGTVLADDPQLTDRTGLERRLPLLRVVLDSKLKIPVDSKLVQSAQQDVLIFCGVDADEKLQAALQAAGVEVIRSKNQQPPLTQVLAELARRGMIHLLVEAGAKINAAFLREDLVDEVVIFRTPLTLGSGSVPFADGFITPRALQKKLLHAMQKSFDRDERIRGLLHDPWRDPPLRNR